MAWRDLKRHFVAHQTFTDTDHLDRAIHDAVTDMNLERQQLPYQPENRCLGVVAKPAKSSPQPVPNRKQSRKPLAEGPNA